MVLQLYDTLTRTKQPFKPLESRKASIYSCGPTVYRDVHIGNLRTYLLADWLRRVLEAQDFQVQHVKNITDVGHMRQELLERGEDKVIAAAIAAGKTPAEIAEHYTESFLRDEQALNIKPAHEFPRATEHIGHMIEMIESLIAKELAYEVSGNVYYRVERFLGYGKLSGNTGEGLLEGVRAEADPLKENGRDFSLWKAAEKGRVAKWSSPWGDGFPGWHIECSAMSTHLLGERFDFHTGGVDNIFPHHEDEIAQSEGALGHQVVGHWVHGQHLLVDGLKMAKSTGNVYTLPQLRDRGFEPMAFRYLCATVHYRKRLNFTFASLRAASAGLSKLRQEAFQAAGANGEDTGAGDGSAWEEAFWDALKDDLHLPRALAAVWRLVRSDASPRVKTRLLRAFDEVLGLDLLPQPSEVPDAVRALIDERQELRRREDFVPADALRKRVEDAGYEVRDVREGLAIVPRATSAPSDMGVLHSSDDVPSFLEQPDEFDFSVILTGRDDLEGLRRAASAVLAQSDRHRLELIVVDNGSSDGTGDWLFELTQQDDRVRAITCDHNIGTGAARNCGLRAAKGTIIVLLDTSVEPTDEFLTPIAAALEDGTTGIVGPFGVNSEDMREFEDAPGPEVDAVEGYLMALRRSLVREVGLMDEKFRFYRHLDLDYSLAIRERGYRNRIVPDLPLRRHAHTDWERTPEDERDRLSKRNFYRFLKKYGHSTDLLLAKST
ncbi:MAG: cysteine--tRNA ligase [Chloroflexi bacterium]|nr:cysteine--tRNA ligase [Chloroflexota bacterium]